MRRRRGRRARVASNATIEEALDLFLDAITNTLGVVIFILIMVVLFSGRPDAERDREPSVLLVDAPEARAVAALLDEAARLEQSLAQAPLEGDPALRARAEALLEEGRRAREATAALLVETAEAVDAARRDARESRLAQEAANELVERRRQLERRILEAPTTSSFVRVSRFHDDPRTPVLLLVAKGGLERAELAPGEQRVVPGARNPRPIRTVDDARSALDLLLAGVAPASHRIEVGVWNDSFTEYKLLERLLVERGFALNPLPIESGRALEAGTGGVQ